jgi:hypothetical protein
MKGSAACTMRTNMCIDTGTMCRSRSAPPGPLGLQSRTKAVFIDELTPIALYITREMTVNAGCD